jgi:hypothetical protein
LAFASDTLSIATMEVVDNLFIIAVPGALAAGLTDSLFWWSLIVSLAVAFVVTVPRRTPCRAAACFDHWEAHSSRSHRCRTQHVSPPGSWEASK